MTAVARADFKYEVTVDGKFTVLIREVCPRDFYWFSLVENDFPDISPTLMNVLILVLLTDLDEDSEQLALIPQKSLAALMHWVNSELLTEKLMRLEQWLEMAFHLCKQRWDSSVEWLEVQPMSKILLMTRVVNKHVTEQAREMKKSGKR